MVKPKRRKGYRQDVDNQQRLQLEYELKSRGFDGSEAEINLLLRGGSIPSGAGLRVFTGTKGCRKMINGASGTDDGGAFFAFSATSDI